VNQLLAATILRKRGHKVDILPRCGRQCDERAL
jgi:hypothetical protein